MEKNDDNAEGTSDSSSTKKQGAANVSDKSEGNQVSSGKDDSGASTSPHHISVHYSRGPANNAFGYG